ncbi:MAG: DNA repair protein [Clostridia bacterium]|nr:DNA repair protein [Clostridia bacterium]
MSNESGEGRVYACIDLKSFYASVECVERGLDPFTTNLVVADPDRQEATICLAITPAMKALGIPNRCRVYEIPKGIKYIMAKPRMRLYMQRSAEIYSIYLRYISPDDIHVYSIDECFIDLTPYKRLYSKTPRELVDMLMSAIYTETGIHAAAGIGTNLFLAKVALDITAKRSPDFVGYLDEELFKSTVAHHRPITDIWNVGHGIARRLSHMGVYDMAGVARLPEKALYREFGVNAEYLIDHANGREPCTIAEIKAYTPRSTSHTNSQVLFEPYSFENAEIILKEMVETSTLELISEHLATDRISLSIGYNHTGKYGSPSFEAPPRTGGSMRLPECTNSLLRLTEYYLSIYRRTTDRNTPIRHVAIGMGELVDESQVTIDMFTDAKALDREHALLTAMVDVKDRFGRNAIVKGISFEEKATTRARNLMIGGHNSD